MPSSQKPAKNTAGDAARQAKLKPKTSQRQTEKPVPQSEAEAELTESETKTASERKSGTTAPTARERKSGALANTARESKPSLPPAGARERKLTPQQQVHLARIKRRRLRQRLGLGTVALVLIVVVAVVIQQAVAKSQQQAQAAATSTRQAILHAAATATAGAKATATENAFAPGTVPTVTGTTVTLADGLQYIDIKVGTGDTVKAGDMINAKYIGWLQSTGVKFDSSYDENKGDKTTCFTLGDSTDPNCSGVIKGWIEGIPGMKVGGTRRLIIPPALAYGDQAQGPIPANSTLIFDVTVVSIGPAGS
jgi:FKBP-type peptidyl-prolyl cis-trans isomerase